MRLPRVITWSRGPRREGQPPFHPGIEGPALVQAVELPEPCHHAARHDEEHDDVPQDPAWGEQEPRHRHDRASLLARAFSRAQGGARGSCWRGTRCAETTSTTE